ncbi:MAG: sugar ABC transporter permease [Nostoc sp.]
MATTSNVQVTISLSEPGLDEEELQAEVQNLLPQIKEVDGVEDADLVAVTEAPQGSKAFGGFLLATLKAVGNPGLIKPLFGFLSTKLSGKTIEIKVEVNGKKLEVKASNQEEFEFARRQAEDFIKNTKDI